MAKQPYGTSTLGVTNFYKGALPSNRDMRSYGPAPRVAGGKVNLEKPIPAPTGVAQVTPPKNVPRTYASKPSILSMLAPTKVITKKPAAPVKKPPVQVISNVVRERPTPTKVAPPARAKPPATRFGVVTGTTTGTKTGGGGGYGGGGTRGGGSLSGGGSGSRSAGTSRTGGTQRNDPVRG